MSVNCRSIDEMRFVLIDLLQDQVSNIEYQHKLRECIYQHRPSRDELGVKVPVVAAIKGNNSIKYVRLGHQFCVRDASAAVRALKSQSFEATCSDSLIT